MTLNAGDHRYKALIVDDEPSILQVLEQVLVDANFIVTTADNGEDAVTYVQSEPIDLLITDIRMPGISGFELMDQMSTLDPTVKIIVMTSYDSYNMIKKAMRVGAYDYLSKPLQDLESIRLCAARAAQATQLVRHNTELMQQLRANHTMLEQANERLRALNEELRIQANTDSLTEINNRRFLDNALTSEVTRRNRYPDPLSVALIDVDHFKEFNDTYGHDSGDVVLKVISARLLSCARNTDIVGRYGGEEFLIILPKTDPESAMLFAERVRNSIADDPVDIEGMTCRVTVSIGVSGVNADSVRTTEAALITSADKALYVAKNEGRHTVRFREVEPESEDVNQGDGKKTGTDG